MGILSYYFSFFFISDILYGNSRSFLPTMEHLPFLTEVSNQDPREPKLTGKHYHSFLFCMPNCFINSNNSAQIIDVAKYNDVIFKALLFIDLSIDFININFVIDPVAYFDQIVSPGFPIYLLF